MITKENILQLAKDCLVYVDTPMYDRTGKYRMLCNDVEFELSDGRILTIRKGFVWDENSIPWIFQLLFPKSGEYAAAALPHDALYYLTQTSKRFADREFVQWMIALDISTPQIIWRWLAVHWFGWKWWRKNLKAPGERCLHNRKLIELSKNHS